LSQIPLAFKPYTFQSFLTLSTQQGVLFMAEQLLSCEEVAMRLSVSEACIRKYILKGQLPIVRIGRLVRLRANDVDAIVQYGFQPNSSARAQRNC
jgi:excisionase family DNA binding protein